MNPFVSSPSQLSKIFAVFFAVLLIAGCSMAEEPEADSAVIVSGGDGVVLVEDGVSLAPIIVYAEAPPRTVAAAEELADYLEKISGARPEVIIGTPEEVPGSAIWVGYQPVLDELFPGIDFEFSHAEEIILAANGRHVVIAGRDRWDPQALDVEIGRFSIEGHQLEYGTANAVYTFLQDQLGVIWLWPGPWGEDIIEQDTIRIAPFEYRHFPQIRARSGMFSYYQLGRGHGQGHDWSRRQRVQLDSLSIPASHGFGDWWERFGATHPEYFALQPDGTRGNYPSAGNVKMCKSNPDVWAQWLRDVEADLEKNPNKNLFSAAANDSWRSGYCVCENCLAWDHPDGEMRAYNWRGLGQEYVAMSDRQVTFANTLARMLREKYPDKEYYVVINAYGPSRPAPVEAVPDDNVIILSVANFFTRPNQIDGASTTGHSHREQFSQWGDVAPNIFWRPNKARHMASMPNISARQAIDDIQFVAEKGNMGIYIDMNWGHWATRGPMYYVLAQMVWDPSQNGEALLEEYFQRGFGPAADNIRGYWDLMEQVFLKSQEDDYDYNELFDEALFEAAYAQLDGAAEAVADSPEKYRERVEFVRIGLDYTRLVAEARKEMIRYNESGETDTDALDRARAIWVEEISPLANSSEHPFALTWGRMNPGHGHSKRDAGLIYPKDLTRQFDLRGNWLGEQ